MSFGSEYLFNNSSNFLSKCLIKYEEKIKNKTKEEINETNKINLNNEEKPNLKKNEYELFFEKGGIKGEILEEKNYDAK